MSFVPIYTGRWQDYSQSSSAMGDVITLNVQWAGRVIAALSTFVAFVGSAAFTIIAFTSHRFLKKNEQSDALTVQFRVLFRNSSSPTSIVWDLWKSYRAWLGLSDRKARPKRLRWRFFLFALLPLLVFAGFTTAGVFVGDVAGNSYSSNNVLIEPSNCGLFLYDDTPEGIRAAQQKNINDTLAGRAYVDSCYRQNGNVAQCSLFPRQAIPYDTTQVSCPFGTDTSGNSLCLYNQGQGFQIDTGLLDTNYNLGINAAPENRILFRKRLTCSPINVTSYIEVDNSTNPIQVLSIGPIYAISEYTYAYQTFLKEAGVGYQVVSIPAGDEFWNPIQPLQVFDGDVSVTILTSSSIRYFAPVGDIWFSANTPIDPGSGLPTVYAADADITAMGCVDQLQVCNPTTNPLNCTIVGSLINTTEAYNSIKLNTYQLATAGRLIVLLGGTASFDSIDALGDSALYARRNVYELISSGLLANQWQIEVRGWFETGLAKLQAAVIEQVARTGELSPYGQLVQPRSNGSALEQASASFCNNQRVRNTGGYQTFSFLALMIVICVGLAILFISVELGSQPTRKLLRKCASLCACVRVRPKSDGADIVRIADGPLQLLKMALWGAGYNTGWERRDTDQPVTTAGEVFELPKRETDDNGIVDCRYVIERGLTLMNRNGRVEENAGEESTDTTPKTGNTTVVQVQEERPRPNGYESGGEGQEDNADAANTGVVANEATDDDRDGGEVTSVHSTNETMNRNT